MKLTNAVEKGHKELVKRTNAMFAFSKKEISNVLKDYQSNILKIVAYQVTGMSAINFIRYASTPVEHTIRREIAMQRDVAYSRIAPIWEQLRTAVALHSRVGMAWIARKSQPPWYPVKLDLSSPIKSKNRVNYNNAILYYLKVAESLVLREIELGCKNEESANDIMKRVRGLFTNKSTARRGAREASFDGSDDQASKKYDMSFTTDLWDKPPVEMSEGVFTAEDIEDLFSHQRAVMDWYYTDYHPDMDEAIWARNRAFMGLEQDLMADIVDQLHQGMLKIGSDNMGIKDMVWVTSKPQPKCDECCDRDGLTMTQIKERIQDKFGSQPPRLHPHCRCQLVPQINDDWTDQQLNRGGYEWDTDNGLAYVPDGDERKQGFTSMTFDQWLGNLSSLQGVPARSVAF